jgi:NADH-quinone oxidoreductase subunit A
VDFQLTSYYPVLLFFVATVGFTAVTLVAAHVIAPRRKRTPVKEMPYESGMDPIGSARQRFDVRFYLIAILFLVFDVELLFLYPWAVSAYELFTGEARRLLTPIFWELLVFIATLALAYVYAWRRGVFKWR